MEHRAGGDDGDGMGPSSRTRTISIVADVVSSAAVGLVGNLATNAIDVTGPWVTVVWAAVAALILAGIVRRRRSSRAEPAGAIGDDDGLATATIALVKAVQSQWKDEMALREVSKPLPLRVRWSSTGRPVAASRDVVMDEPTGADWRELPLKGDVEDIAAAYRTLPHGQLVVLGEPGAGKSVLAMLLTLGLIKELRPGESIPVLLPVASWNLIDDIDVFLVRRLSTDFEFLARRGNDGKTVAERLVADVRILPVLDGLDELPAAWHSRAIEVLDHLASKGRPFVVTCRSGEYERAVVDSGSLLSRAAVVELEPLGVTQVTTFLSHPAPARSRWQPVFEHLRRNPHGALAQVLSTPLMVALARTAYHLPATRPQELVGLGDRASIQRKLLDAFVVGAYQAELPNPLPGRITGSRRGICQPQQARRWLGCLAYHLYQQGTRDLCWWQVTSSAMSVRPDRTRFMVPVFATMAIVGAVQVGVGLAFGPDKGNAAVLLVLALVFTGIFRSIWPDRYPLYTPTFVSFLRPIPVQRAVPALSYGVLFGLLAGLVLNATLFGLVCGVLCGLVAIAMPAWRLAAHMQGATPQITVDHNHRNALAAAVQYGFVGGVIFALAAWTTPGSPGPLSAGLVAIATYGISAACGAGLGTWIWFRLNHLLLALNGWLPPRFWAFLNDAHRRGALRQAGTVWQFRHALLQEHLVPPVRLEILDARAAAGDQGAADKVLELLAAQGQFDKLKTRADAGNYLAAAKLPGLLTQFGRVDEAIAVLAARADAGDERASRVLADLLVAHDRLDELRARAEAGDNHAADRLPNLSSDRGHVDPTIARLREQAEAGSWPATSTLTRLLVRNGRAAEAVTLLRRSADKNHPMALEQLAELLIAQGSLREALPVMLELSSSGSERARTQLPGLLVALGRLDDAIAELQAQATAGDRTAARRADQLCGKDDRNDRPAAHATIRSLATARRNAAMLAKQGHPEKAIALLRVSADSGNLGAVHQLVDLFVELGHPDEAIAFLRVRADDGEWGAAAKLAQLLADQDRADDAITVLRAHLEDGDRAVVTKLADLLETAGRLDDAIAVLRTYDRDRHVAAYLDELLDNHDRVDELRARANLGDANAAIRLARRYANQGRTRDAQAILLIPAASGHWEAVVLLARMLTAQNVGSD